MALRRVRNDPESRFEAVSIRRERAIVIQLAFAAVLAVCVLLVVMALRGQPRPPLDEGWRELEDVDSV